MIERVFPIVGTGGLAVLTVLSAHEAMSTLNSHPSKVEKPWYEKTDVVASSVAKPQLQRQPAEDLLSAISNRPLFAPTRRPTLAHQDDSKPSTGIQTVIEPETPKQPMPPEVVLHGIIKTDNGFAALISSPGTIAAWLPRGSDVQGWALEEIGNDWVVLTNDTLRYKVEMY